MSVTSGPNLSASDLIFAYDMYNTKSNIGAPVTNLLPTPTINSVPTTGNGWGTYNTNQYGSGAYFSIGTVSSISGNVVTMTVAHSLRSYDVMQPQSSGGGVTGGTNYLIKKLSSTTFSLHPYNGSQDGSQGYINPATGTHKVYDDFANDVKISINSSGFPTMWWGYPHLPNSGLVKEVRTNGCSIPGYPTTDCLRLYHTRPDGVTDGMAYGVDTPVTAGVAHTVSFWTKTVNAAAVGQSISYQIYNYGIVSPAGYSFSATLGAVGVWVKQSMTFTPVNPTCISYFFPSSGNIVYDLAHIQFETGSIATNWTSSSRTTSQAILDLTNKNTITATSLTYASNNTFSFNGSSNYISVSYSSILNTPGGATYSIWLYPTGASGEFLSRGTSDAGATPDNPRFYIDTAVKTFYLDWSTPGSDKYVTTSANSYPSNNTWINVVGTATPGGRLDVYVNGTVCTYSTRTAGADAMPSPLPNTTDPIQIGGVTWIPRYFTGNISAVLLYNRVLSATEIQQNFNALRTRYGI